MPSIDLSQLREDAQKLAAPSRTPESGQVLEDPGAVGRRQLQDARGALNAEAAAPGQEPDTDPVDAAFAAAQRYPRGSEERMGAYFEKMVEAAHAGDPRAMARGAMNDETRQAWHEAAQQRQVANRDQSGAAHR